MSVCANAKVPEHELLSLSKRKLPPAGEQQARVRAQTSKRRRSYSVDVKAQAIQMRQEKGMSLQQIVEAFGLPQSGGKKMVRTWIKDKDKILGALGAEKRVPLKVRR